MGTILLTLTMRRWMLGYRTPATCMYLLLHCVKVEPSGHGIRTSDQTITEKFRYVSPAFYSRCSITQGFQEIPMFWQYYSHFNIVNHSWIICCTKVYIQTYSWFILHNKQEIATHLWNNRINCSTVSMFVIFYFPVWMNECLASKSTNFFFAHGQQCVAWKYLGIFPAFCLDGTASAFMWSDWFGLDFVPKSSRTSFCHCCLVFPFNNAMTSDMLICSHYVIYFSRCRKRSLLDTGRIITYLLATIANIGKR